MGWADSNNRKYGEYSPSFSRRGKFSEILKKRREEEAKRRAEAEAARKKAEAERLAKSAKVDTEITKAPKGNEGTTNKGGSSSGGSAKPQETSATSAVGVNGRDSSRTLTATAKSRLKIRKGGYSSMFVGAGRNIV